MSLIGKYAQVKAPFNLTVKYVIDGIISHWYVCITHV